MADEFRREPNPVEEKAWFLVAKGEYEACVEPGDAAVPVLLEKLKDRSPHVTPAEYEFLSELPAARVCDHALRALLRFGWEVGLSAIQCALADGDNLLKAHAINGLKRIKQQIEDKSKSPHVRPTSPFSGAAGRIPVPVGIFWDEVVVLIEQQGITKLLGELTSDNSPVIEEGLLATFLEESERHLLHDLPDQAFDSETEVELAKLRGLLRFLWQRPIGCHGITGLSAIRTPEAIRLLLRALESSEPEICADAIGAVGKWLGDFPDSGWGCRELIPITPEVEQLREDTVNKLADLLQDETIVNTGIEMLSVGFLAAEALTLSGTDAAKSALESWKGFEGRELLPPI